MPGRKILFLKFALLVCIPFWSSAQVDILLKDYEPVSIYNTPKASIEKAKFPVVDFHTHPYAKSDLEIQEWLKTMDRFGIKKSIILTYSTGKRFDSIYNRYSKYGERFELWCGFDYTGFEEDGWSKKAVKELERCYEVGARGVGELGDKGVGLFYSKPSPSTMHIDDDRLKPLLERCGELSMPVSVHVADPYWMYLPMDKHNDGLMNAYTWRIDQSQENLLQHSQLVQTLENAVSAHPNTTFIACHLANCSFDLNILGKLLETYPNLYADISARYAEIAPIPRFVKAFFEKHQNKLVYGTDMGIDPSVYETTLRILESADEHFYVKKHFSYHWPLNGLDLDDETLKKLYSDNAKKILRSQ